MAVVESAVPVGLAPVERAELLLEWIGRGIQYSGGKRASFRAASSVTKVATLILSAVSTIILGVQDLDFWAGIGFALVALVTVVSAVEPFFNWRSRWVLMEEQLHRFYRLEDDLRMELAKAPPAGVSGELIDRYYAMYRGIWSSSARRWLEFRKAVEQR